MAPAHPYVAEPSVVQGVEGPSLGHGVPNRASTAVFFDGRALRTSAFDHLAADGVEPALTGAR